MRKTVPFVLVAMFICLCVAPVYAAKPAKESGAQMTPETNAAYADAYKKLEAHSGFKGIGKPVGYTCDGSMSAGTSFGFSYIPDSKELKQADKEAYAKAIWNLCIDAESSAPYKKQFSGGKELHIEYKSFSETLNKAENYDWHYKIGTVEHRAVFYFKGGEFLFLVYKDE